MKTTITKRVCFSSAHRLQNDPGKCKNLHGHNYVAYVTVTGQVGKDGVIAYFKEIKEAIWEYTKNFLDHAAILEQGDPLIVLLNKMGMSVVSLPYPPTTENIARSIKENIGMPAGVKITEIKVWEDEDQLATITI